MAGEPASNAIVIVGPPLFAKVPSNGLPVKVGEQEPSWIKLLVLALKDPGL
jgi:hypothetical protein